MNVNLHCMDQKVVNLGLCRVRGKCGAKELVNVLKLRLLSYGVNLDTDVFSITTDGAAVMVKMGKMVKPLHLLCLAHALHLAVGDLLYDKKKKKKNKSTSNDDDKEESSKNVRLNKSGAL